MPGYPLLLLVNTTLFSDYAYFATRIFQLLALAIAAGLIKVALQKYVCQELAIASAVMFSILPIWHFVPVLIGEAITAVVICILLFCLSKVHNSTINLKITFIISVCVAVLTYIKPNNILIVFPILGFFLFSKKSEVTKTFFKILVTILLLMSPWMIFANGAQKGFIGFTANSGINAYIGTGMILKYDESALARSAIKWKVDPKQNPLDIVIDDLDLNPLERNSIFTQKAIQIWEKRFWSQLAYGFEKVKFAFSLNSPSILGALLGIFNVLGLLAGIALLKFAPLRSWGIALLLIVLTLSVQAIVFQADRRFVVPIFSPFAAFCMGLVFSKFLTTFREKSTV
jgi:hypothetical protein